MKRIFSVLFVMFMVIGCAIMGGVFLTEEFSLHTEEKFDEYQDVEAKWTTDHDIYVIGVIRTSSSDYTLTTSGTSYSQVGFDVYWRDENGNLGNWGTNGHTWQYSTVNGYNYSKTNQTGINMSYLHYNYYNIFSYKRCMRINQFRPNSSYQTFGVTDSLDNSAGRSVSSGNFYVANGNIYRNASDGNRNASTWWHKTVYVYYRQIYNIKYYNKGSHYGTQTTYAGIGFNLWSAPTAPTGYHFGGWRETSASGNPVHSAGAWFEDSWANCSKTFEAVWTPNVVKINLNASGGSGGRSAIWFKYGTNTMYSNSSCTTTISSVSLPSRTGYNFSRYYSVSATQGASSGESYIYSDGTWAGDLCTDFWSDATLTAEWTPKIIKINFNASGGSGGRSAIWFKYGTNTMYSDSSCTTTISSVSLPSRTGYTFSRYYSVSATQGASSGESYIYSDGTWAGDLCTDFWSDATLTAEWTPNTYTVSFNANGGTGTMSNRTWVYDTWYSITNSFSRTGYTFSGWQISTGSSVTHYYGTSTSSYSTTTSSTWTYSNSGTSYFKNLRPSSGTVTMYAQWTPNTYTVSFDANGGSVSPTSKSVTFGSSYGSLPKPIRANYTPTAWRNTYNLIPNSSTIINHDSSWTGGWCFYSLRDNGVYLTEGKTYRLTFDMRINSSSNITQSWYNSDLFINDQTKRGTLVNGDGSSDLKPVTTSWQTYTGTFVYKRDTTSASYQHDPLHIYPNYSQSVAGQITNLKLVEEIVDSSSIVTTAANHTLTVDWIPNAVTHSVNLRVISPDGKSVTETTLGGTVRVEGYQISGASSSFKTLSTNQTTISASYSVHAGQQFKLTATPNQGYVFAGFSTSSTPSDVIKNPTSPPTKHSSYYSTNNNNYYVYFKQVSPNQLKYDETDKYFYFEDGYYPQSEANVLKNISVETGDFANVNIGWKSEENILILNGTYSQESHLKEIITTESIPSIKAGSNVKLKVEFLSGAVTGGGRVTFGWSLYNSNGANVEDCGTPPTIIAGDTIFSGTISSSVSNGYFKIYIWRNVDNGGSPTFTNAKFKVSIQYDYLSDGATANGEKFTYNDGSQNIQIPVYTYNNEKYVKVTKGSESKWFKFEPIRWRISDYGVEKTETNYIKYEALRKYTGYATNFTAVSDLILGVGAMHNTREVREGTSVTSMKGFQLVQETTDGCSITFQYAKSGNVIKVDNYSTSTQNNAVSTGTTAYSAPLRIASLEEITSLGLVNKGARASDMVAFILGQDKNNVTYWTRDLSNLGSGVAITSTGTKVQTWLNQLQGMRFAYTFSEGSNAGGGDLEFDRLNYIESTGTQEINTEIIFNPETDNMEITFESTDVTQNGMILANSNTQNHFWFYYYWETGSIDLYVQNSLTQYNINTISRDTIKHTASYKNKTLYLDNISYGSFTETFTTCETPLFISSWGNAYFWKGKIYACKIWSRDVLVRDFVPVRNVYTGEVGLLDKVSGRFFGNSGTGSFVAG